MSDTQQPHSPEIERALLGAVITDPELLKNGANTIKAGDFHIRRHRTIWEALHQLSDAGHSVDVLTLSHELDRQGQLDEIGGPAFLTQVAAECPSSLHAEEYVRRVLEDSERRRLLDRATAIAKLAYSKEPLPPGERSAKAAGILAIEAPAASDDDLWSAAELCALELPGADWLLQGHIPAGGIVLLAGEVAGGKTWCALDIGIAAAAGAQALGGAAFASEIPTLYLGADNSWRTLAQRVRMLVEGRGITPPAAFQLYQAPIDLASAAGLSRLRRMVADTGARLVVVDVLARYVRGVDENAAGEIGPVFGDLRALANESGASFMVLHHLNKLGIAQKAAAWLAGIRGSADIPGSVDTAYTLTTAGEWPSIVRSLKQRKNRDAEEADALTFTLQPTDLGGMLLAWEGQVTTADLEPVVLAYVQNHPGQTKSEIVKALGRGRTRVFGAISSLDRRGEVTTKKAERGAVRVTATSHNESLPL